MLLSLLAKNDGLLAELFRVVRVVQAKSVSHLHHVALSNQTRATSANSGKGRVKLAAGEGRWLVDALLSEENLGLAGRDVGI